VARRFGFAHTGRSRAPRAAGTRGQRDHSNAGRPRATDLLRCPRGDYTRSGRTGNLLIGGGVTAGPGRPVDRRILRGGSRPEGGPDRGPWASLAGRRSAGGSSSSRIPPRPTAPGSEAQGRRRGETSSRVRLSKRLYHGPIVQAHHAVSTTRSACCSGSFTARRPTTTSAGFPGLIGI
jgi:hypothetical protein